MEVVVVVVGERSMTAGEPQGHDAGKKRVGSSRALRLDSLSPPLDLVRDAWQ